MAELYIRFSAWLLAMHEQVLELYIRLAFQLAESVVVDQVTIGNPDPDVWFEPEPG